ncbi:MAG: DNA polymerase elongation [Bacteroidetes bacterium]|nr:MAG: DNA polymerase elongation [Bacteroidota bacterium]
MLGHVKIEKVLFLDIETVPQYPTFDQVPEKLRQLWEHKAIKLKEKEEITVEKMYERAGIYSEFGKIICISVGFIHNNQLRIKSFASDNESQLLNDFAVMLQNNFSKPGTLLCAHNGKEFDFPYISRRMLINGIELPPLLDIAGKKPWDIQHLDTMELWKFGDYKNYTSLALLTAIFNIPTPKDDIDGSQVGQVYWQDNDLKRIVTYCQKDVVAIAQLLLRYKGMPLIEENDIIFT